MVKVVLSITIVNIKTTPILKIKAQIIVKIKKNTTYLKMTRDSNKRKSSELKRQSSELKRKSSITSESKKKRRSHTTGFFKSIK